MEPNLGRKFAAERSRRAIEAERDIEELRKITLLMLEKHVAHGEMVYKLFAKSLTVPSELVTKMLDEADEKATSLASACRQQSDDQPQT